MWQVRAHVSSVISRPDSRNWRALSLSVIVLPLSQINANSPCARNKHVNALWQVAHHAATCADTVRAGAPLGRHRLPDRRGSGAVPRLAASRGQESRLRDAPSSGRMNPYRGCTHGCPMLRAQIPQAVRMNAATTSSRRSFAWSRPPSWVRCGEAARRPSWAGELVAIGIGHRMYQPIEWATTSLTRGALELPLGAALGDASSPRADISATRTCWPCCRAIGGRRRVLRVPCVTDAVCSELAPSTGPGRQRCVGAAQRQARGARSDPYGSPRSCTWLSSKSSTHQVQSGRGAPLHVACASRPGGNVMHLEEGAPRTSYA